VLGSIVATGGSNGILVNVPGGTVTLRNLMVVHLTSSQYGIYMVSASELNVADCEIAGPLVGIYASAANGSVTVKDTVLRGSNTGFYAISTVVASLAGVHAKDNTYGVLRRRRRPGEREQQRDRGERLRRAGLCEQR
jgi:hypothetical protein